MGSQNRGYRIALLLSTLFLILAAFAAGWTAFWLLPQLQLYGSIPLPNGWQVRTAEPATDTEMALFWEAMKLLDENYYYQEQLPRGEQLTYAAVEGVIAATGDPHTAFMDPERARIVASSLEGQFEGIGAQVDMAEEGLVIVAPFPNTPAALAGLQPGDLVLEVDGTPTKGMTIMEAVSRVRGPKGTVVRLTVRRESVPELLSFDVTRDTIVIPVVETKMIEEGGGSPIGYIKLYEFNGQSTEAFRDGLQDLLDQGADRLIVDLRNNPGGYLDAAVAITSEFIGDGVILSDKGSNGRENSYPAREGGIATEIPLVVLINEGSASASEIFAGAVRDRERGTLIGQTTFGKGSVQTTASLSDGSNLRVTIARWFTPDGLAIHEVGIEPDIFVEQAPEGSISLANLGLEVQLGPEGLIVSNLAPEGPAAQAGLQQGDVILQFNSVPTAQLTSGDVASLAEGIDGSAVELLVRRDGEDEPREFSLIRDNQLAADGGDPQLDAAIDFFRDQE